MRIRYLALFALAAVTYFAYQYRDRLPERSAVIMSLRHQAQPPKITFATDPAGPGADERFALKVHVDDPEGRPIAGMVAEAHLSMMGVDHTDHSLILHDKGSGDYVGTTSLNLPGKWDVEIIGTKEGSRTRAKFELDVGAARIGHSDDDNEEPLRFR
jgi:hypothetical protein